MKGFTFIEILVSIGILLLLSGFFLAGYNRFNESQKVQQAAATLVRNLQAARTKAASGVKPAGCTTLVGYTVSFTATTYATQALCQAPVGEINTYTLPTDVTFPAPTPAPITFYALDRGASANPTITLTGTTTSVNVTVLASGVVSGTVATPTP